MTAENPFKGYIEKIKPYREKRINPVHEIVNLYYVLNNIHDKPSSFYTGRYGYGKLCREAKDLLYACDNDIEVALWAVDKMKYKAEKGKFDWSIITCLKHKLN